MNHVRWRLPQGDLPCTFGNHTLPHDQFAVTKKGIDSWCRKCRRGYNTQLKADKRAEAAAITARQSQDNSCSRYPQD